MAREHQRDLWTYAEESVLPKPGGTEPSGENSGLKSIRNVDWKLYNDGRLYDMKNDASKNRPYGLKKIRTVVARPEEN